MHRLAFAIALIIAWPASAADEELIQAALRARLACTLSGERCGEKLVELLDLYQHRLDLLRSTQAHHERMIGLLQRQIDAQQRLIENLEDRLEKP